MIQDHEREWSLVCARECLCPRTVERFRNGLPIRRSSLVRILRAVEALGLQRILSEQATTRASAK